MRFYIYLLFVLLMCMLAYITRWATGYSFGFWVFIVFATWMELSAYGAYLLSKPPEINIDQE